MTNWAHMSALVASIPELPEARCKGKAELFDATISRRRADGGPTRKERNTARAAALRLCADCPALDECRAWLDGLRPSRRPRGVVAGQVVTT